MLATFEKSAVYVTSASIEPILLSQMSDALCVWKIRRANRPAYEPLVVPDDEAHTGINRRLQASKELDTRGRSE